MARLYLPEHNIVLFPITLELVASLYINRAAL